MFRNFYIALLLLVIFLSGCSPADKTIKWSSPDETWGELFVAVQQGAVFPDSKTFADCIPKSAPDKVLAAYKAESQKPDFDLKKFVETHFDLPPNPAAGYQSNPAHSTSEHITALWDVLLRKPDNTVAGSSLIPLPHPYIVPGGRFREVYYWDSYFTMLGLQTDGRWDIIENINDNFAYLIDTLGFIPNGNRTYYKGRSQPPFYSLMVALNAEGKGDQVLVKYLPALEKEHQFWMKGQEKLTPKNNAVGRVVMMPDSSILNRYWDDIPKPRPESWREDVALAAKLGPKEKEDMYRHLKAAAESGWDFSSRWFADGKTLATIHTTDFVPVDLNCLLFHLEKTISAAYAIQKEGEKANLWADKAAKRRLAIQKYCWNNEAAFFLDYDFVKKSNSNVLSLAGAYPLFFELATKSQAASVAARLEKDFLQAGGFTTTLSNTGQQWDAPNGWAPLEWMTIKGLMNYEHFNLATKAKKRWLDVNVKVFKNTGKMTEKYNVYDLSLEAGGGEYPVQDGFGWSNGVYQKLLQL
jgi:alpha,alpha-trehalase